MYDDQPRYITGPSRKRSTKDPFAARLGLIVLGFILLLPIALIVRPGSGNTVRTSGLPGGVGLLQPASADTATSAQPERVASDAGTVASAAATEAATSAAEPAATEVPVAADATASQAATVGASATTPADDAVAAAQTAAAANTSSAPSAPALSAAKRAPTTTSARARKTTTTAPATTVAKQQQAPATTTAPTTEAPPKTTTTKVPTTTAPAPKSTTTRPKPIPATTTTTTTTVAPVKYTSAQIVAIITSIWPADLQTKALAIALRESNNQPTAVNYCCYGLFQINYPANQAWLNSVGISNPIQLFDPKTNASIALLMYQRSGWAPWGG